MNYETWIADYLKRVKNPFARCLEACDEMKAAFPELTTVRGHILDLRWSRRSHVWLTTTDGAIVDPTASQFPALYEYEPWTPDSLVRLGKCMECGAEIWGKVESLDVEPPMKSVCGDACERALMAGFA